MATSSIPYVQDVDQWIAYYMNMAEKKVIDPNDAYASGNGSLYYPVETKRNVIFREKEEPVESKGENVKVEMVTSIQQSAEQIEAEVKDQKEAPASTLPPPLAIKLPQRRRRVIRERVTSRTTPLSSTRDQLSRSRMRD